MRIFVRGRIAIAISLGALLLAGVGGALGQALTSHTSMRRSASRAAHTKTHKTRKRGASAQAASQTAAPVVLSASTEDTTGAGHINGIRLALSTAPRKTGLASVFIVAGYRITGVRVSGTRVDVLLAAHAGYDTGARPTVKVAGLRGLNGKLSPTVMITPKDGARPVVVSASTADLAGAGRIDAIDLVLTEPVVVTKGAIGVTGFQVEGTRDYSDGELAVLLRPSGQPDTAALPTVMLNGAHLRDAGGNEVPSGAVRLSSGAAPVMVGAQDKGFWLSGERIETIWSAPVHASGPGGAGPFAMSTAGGRAITATAIAAGDAPNEIAVDLPLGAETPTQIAYRATAATRIVDARGHAGAASRWPVAVTQSPPRFAGTLSDPIDQNQMLPFGERSFYIQPWRSYLDTFPATRMLNAVGINFNVNNGNTDDVDQGARLLHDAGFTHARIGIPWNAMDYNNPGQIGPNYLPAITNELLRLKANGIRPLILLQSNDGIPCPVQNVTLNLTAPAAAGATTVQLDSASAALVQPGLTGFRQYGRDGGVLITSVNSSNVATLSQPLQTALQAGQQSAYNLKFQPFFPEYNTDATPNSNNQATLSGWLQYVQGVAQTVKSVVGDDNFDVEVWNELSFGSDFLSAANYYSPAPQGSGNIYQEVLQSTVSSIRSSSAGLPDVGIGDGFANEAPWPSGANEVPGLTAIDKHPYRGALKFPSQATFNGNTPVDALGARDGTQVSGQWHDSFVPPFTALLPEYFLTGIQTETVTRDLAPFISDVYGTLHGRNTHPVGASAPQMWVTEVNADASSVNNTLTSPDGSATSPMSAADLRHFESKAILRYLSAWVGKGTAVIDFFAAANAGGLDLIEPSFFASAEKTHAYPGLSAGGETMVAVRRYLDTMAGAQNLTQTQPLQLDSISDYDGAYQFPGNGTPAYPPLYNRNVVAFFPFQVNQNKWVIPTYVMTQDLATLYNKTAPAGDVTRQDLPPEVFRLTIGGVDPATASAAATDPLTGDSVPVKITGRYANSISVEIPLTDSPRMLVLTDG